MARVITVSRTFPAYHQKKGQPTYFVEKIWKSIWDNHKGSDNPLYPYWMDYDRAFPATDELGNIHNHTPKHHTIRAGKRWKTGDMASLRVWSGNPYNSPQITIAPDVELVVYDFEVEIEDDLLIRYINGFEISYTTLQRLAENDGLTLDEMQSWFKMPREFSGQILCWNKEINY